MPQNKGPDRNARFLDRAVIETVHISRDIIGEPAYDTVRGAFWEGGEVYPGACFEKKNHIQVAVRDLPPPSRTGVISRKSVNDPVPDLVPLGSRDFRLL